MKRRYVYAALFGLPALLASLIISILLFGAAAGILWIFIYGDNPWPASAGSMLTAVFALACITLWAAFMYAAYLAGKKQEGRGTLNMKHMMVSAGITALLILLIILHQWRVGNLGTRSDDVVCSEFCRDRGFAGSGMPPRDAAEPTCSCFDNQGREAVKVPLREVTGRQAK
ncbi:MAG: hypothetical protein ACYC69_06745 [Thermodesulfovibrionales bacterium]